MSQMQLDFPGDLSPRTAGRPAPVRGQEVPRLTSDQLNIEDKTRSNLFPWRGQFSPQLCEALLGAYGKRGGMVADPFVGSGTVLVEAARLGMAAIGAEVNPAAGLLARTYELCATSSRERRSLVETIDAKLKQLAPDDAPLWGRGKARDLGPALVKLALGSREAEQVLLDALVVLMDLDDEPVPPGKLRSTWTRLSRLVSDLPQVDRGPRLLLCDARRLPVPDGSTDLVLFSPPYINVFNYHQQYRRSVEALGWDVLVAAQSEIGANRKFRSNRFLTLVQYHLDMAAALAECSRICRRRGRMILVVGRESNVRKTAFANGGILKALGTAVLGMSLVLEQERVFTNRFGQSIYEDILHFVPSSTRAVADRDLLISLAREALVAARRRVHADARRDLEDAIERAHEVLPSPLAAPTRAHALD